MGNAGKPLRFKLRPCPTCNARLTVDNVQQIGESYWAVLHNCPKTPGETFIQCTGDNMRMTVQKWNKYAREWKP